MAGAAAGPVAAESPRGVWERVVERCERRPRLRLLAGDLTLAEVGGGRAVIEAPAAKLGLAEHHRDDWVGLLRETLGQAVRLEFRAVAAPVQASAPAALAGDGARAEGEPPRAVGDEQSDAAAERVIGGDPESHPLVREAAALFGAKVTRVERRPR